MLPGLEIEDVCARASPPLSCLPFPQAVITIASAVTVMLLIVLGNFIVVVTVYRDRKLRMQRQNWLIVSLAVADLLVGLLVMPLTLTYEVFGEWRMGMLLCETWLALDVLFVTASILHICAISLDRYFSVTSPLTYPAKRTPQRMITMIAISWLVSLLICLPPILGWRPERKPGECSLSTDIGYVLYSAMGSFYIPVIVLICVYAKIYSITIRHSRQRLKETERRDKTLVRLTATASIANRTTECSAPASDSTQKTQTPEMEEENSDPNDEEKDNNKMAINQVCWHLRKISEELSQVTTEEKKSQLAAFFSSRKEANGNCNREENIEKRRRKLKAKERQATLLLGIILSAFILSWLPFFLMYLLGAFGMEAPEIVFKFFFWLGYCNSGINPVIYTVFNREFKRGLCRQLRKFERSFSPFTNTFK
ncbi:unnamed protein product, partial [Mesorhabditis belari]|uniref:G-protein coupled receptors family 1 profile domain-containing protein n=1 Tax=Mesorhabditis belari TaxID=2138241 RepID=A0AAF3EH50_9BILA